MTPAPAGAGYGSIPASQYQPVALIADFQLPHERHAQQHLIRLGHSAVRFTVSAQTAPVELWPHKSFGELLTPKPIAAVHDGADALALARERTPGFVILDIMLPRVDGWEICRELRKLSEVPILMLTARGEEETVPTPNSLAGGVLGFDRVAATS